MDNYIYLIPLLPLIGFVINGLFGKKMPKALVHFVANLAIFLSFVISALALWKVIETGEAVVFTSGSWIESGSLNISLGLKIDQLSAVMINIITGIGFLIHFYSIGYMKGDEGVYKFFAYLNLFCFAMLVLVMGDNLLLLFLGWEGVGLCSYLLIGFWYKKEDYADAGKKAFIVNRVGDFGFLLGIFLIFGYLGTVSFSGIEKKVAEGLPAVPDIFQSLVGTDAGLLVTLITLFLFVGATGKSAQIPLYTWLPDAMAGPTPVSALIHAATMVTAGVYMIGRLHFLFSLSETTMLVILIVGGVTALYSGTIGLTQTDIKKVLAYSTVSQLGYMFMAMAVGAFSVGVFHLMTHAFFKALLFLGSGSVILACHHEQEMTKMGGLSKRLPVTYITMFIGMLALSGTFPYMSGFMSKDLILEKVKHFNSPLWASAGDVIWIVGVLAAMFTAFYSFRLMGMTFWGKTKMTDEEYHHVKEPSWKMSGVLIVLAILSVFGGVIGLTAMDGNLHSFLSKYFGEQNVPVPHIALPTVLGIVAAVIAGLMYGKNWSFPDSFSGKGIGKLLHKLSYNKYYVDEIYDFLFVKPVMKGSHYLWKWFDVLVVDGIVNGVAKLSRIVGLSGQSFHAGNMNSYALSITLGVIALLAFYYIGIIG
ncbi:MAG: NADH-quinone oxidoreductase subunit L [Spirochaetota bacterium]|nr:NADH-quinone oxidoreductase subunit L [Spirochaetota bacterium]